MKIFRQLILVIGIYLTGEFCSKVLHIPLPGNIIGMLLLLLLLITKVVKVSMVEDISDFFLKYLAFLFVPAGVSLIKYFDIVKSDLLNILLLSIFITGFVVVSTGWTVQGIIMINDKIKRKKQ